LNGRRTCEPCGKLFIPLTAAVPELCPSCGAPLLLVQEILYREELLDELARCFARVAVNEALNEETKK
jgi:predicted RNA-binding Zn-ribbon protein involved in translation (DUF1610 family)